MNAESSGGWQRFERRRRQLTAKHPWRWGALGGFLGAILGFLAANAFGGDASIGTTVFMGVWLTLLNGFLFRQERSQA